MLTKQYQLFTMLPNENINEMFTRFSDFINPLKALGKTFTTEDIVQKILSSLPSNWNAKVTNIEEAQDLSKISFEDIMGKLMAHKVLMESQSNNETSKKKGITLKADSDSESSEKEVNSLYKKFNKFLKSDAFRKKDAKKKDDSDSGSEKEQRREIRCYECRKKGHTRPKCPKLKSSSSSHSKSKNKVKEKKHKNAFNAIWGDMTYRHHLHLMKPQMSKL